MSPAEIARILLAHGVADVLITTEDVGRYHRVELPEGVEVWGRSRILEAQERLATIPGVTVLLHDQACAAQNRRLRKRGQLSTPGQRVVINHRICEGCGDCGEVSNCLSVQPLATPLGTKTTIDQSSCNLDFSCLDGDCPAFMTVVPEALAASPLPDQPAAELEVPDPVVPLDRLAVRLTGIGGTGVVTVAQIIGTAAMLDGWSVRGLDQTGLSQKAGPVVSDLLLRRDAPAATNLIGEGEADVIVAFDLLTAAADKSLHVCAPERTIVIGSTTGTPTGTMIGHPEREYPDDASLQGRLAPYTRAAENRWVDAGAMVRALFGDGAQANTFMLGVALQAGCLPIDPELIERAIDLNGVAVDANIAAFHWGRQWVVDPAPLDALVAAQPVTAAVEVAVPDLAPKLATRVEAIGGSDDLSHLLTMLGADLVAYQSEKYAAGFLDTVESVARAERSALPGSEQLTEAAARGLHKLLAYKDEYEVARLLLGPEAKTAAEAVGGPDARVHWHLHPPMLSALGMSNKLKLDTRLGRPVMAALARSKRVRGTPLDPFGRTAMRRLERALPGEYREALDVVTAHLTADNVDTAVVIAALPLQVRGYEELKMSRAAEYRSQLTQQVNRFKRGT